MQSITTPEPGIYSNIPMEIYRTWNAANQSFLSEMRRSPAHALESKKNLKTESFITGDAIHKLVLEPELFHEEFREMPDITTGILTKQGKQHLRPKSTTEYAERLQTLKDENPGVKFIESEQLEEITATAQRINSNEQFQVLKENASSRELSCVWECPFTGVLCKGRFDLMVDEFDMIVDLKTTTDSSPSEFSRSIFKFGYYLQAAFYVTGARALGLPIKHFVIVAAEKKAPFGIAFYRISEADLCLGSAELCHLLKLYRECRQSGVFPVYDENIVDTKLPKWAVQNVLRVIGDGAFHAQGEKFEAFLNN